METQARFPLQGELKYATRDGETREAEFIEMNAPKGKQVRHAAAFRQAIVRAVGEENDREAKDVETPEPAESPETGDNTGAGVADGLDVVNLLARSSVDLGGLYVTARELFVVKGVLLIDGEVKMTTHLLDNMDGADFEKLVGSYIANFTLRS